jgi:hypothetical protein
MVKVNAVLPLWAIQIIRDILGSVLSSVTKLHIGMVLLDYYPIYWIELGLTIQSQNWILDLDCQSSFVISIQIQNFIIILSKN